MERACLSAEARYGLRLIRLSVEGYRVSGKGMQTAQRVARREFAVELDFSRAAIETIAFQATIPAAV